MVEVLEENANNKNVLDSFIREPPKPKLFSKRAELDMKLLDPTAMGHTRNTVKGSGKTQLFSTDVPKTLSNLTRVRSHSTIGLRKASRM